MCHGMSKKVVQLRARQTPTPVPSTRSRVNVKVGRQRFAMAVTCHITPLPSEAVTAPKLGCVEELQVETKFLRLYKPVAIGDRIDGWRVCWLGGWDKSRILFVVMVERVVHGSKRQ